MKELEEVTYELRISEGRERISSGIPFPVKKTANSLVKLLQLCSNRSYFAGLY